jgi:serine/arginine repetitive matrix protein 2
MPYLSRKEYCSVFPGIPMKEITLSDGTKVKRAIDINGNTLSAAETYKLWNKEYKKWEKECQTKKSSKRKSPKRKSSKRKSSKRKSSKRSSKRRSTKRKSSKRSSKRRSTKRKSPKRKSSKRRYSPIRKLRKYYPSFVGKRVQRFERPPGF